MPFRVLGPLAFPSRAMGFLHLITLLLLLRGQHFLELCLELIIGGFHLGAQFLHRRVEFVCRRLELLLLLVGQLEKGSDPVDDAMTLRVLGVFSRKSQNRGRQNKKPSHSQHETPFLHLDHLVDGFV